MPGMQNKPMPGMQNKQIFQHALAEIFGQGKLEAVEEFFTPTSKSMRRAPARTAAAGD